MNKEIIKSKFNLTMTISVIGITILLVGLLSWIIYVWLTDMKEIGIFQRIMVTFFPLLVTLLIFKIELPKIKILTICSHILTIKDPIFGGSKKLSWKDFDGYQTVVHYTQGGPLKELMLIANNKIVHEVSENYISNYDEVKKAITKNLKNLGSINFNYIKYLKQRLWR